MLSSLMCAVGLAACCGLCCLKDQPQIKAAYYNSVSTGSYQAYSSSSYNYGEFLISDFDTSNNTRNVYDFSNPDTFDSVYSNYLDNVWQGSNAGDTIRETYEDFSYSFINSYYDYVGNDLLLMLRYNYSSSLNKTFVTVSFGLRAGFLNEFQYGAFVFFETYFADTNIYPSSISYDYHINPFIYNLISSEYDSNLYDMRVVNENISQQNELSSDTDNIGYLVPYYWYHLNSTSPYLSGIYHDDYSCSMAYLPFSMTNYSSYFYNEPLKFPSNSNYFVWNNYSVRLGFDGDITNTLKYDSRYHISVWTSNGNGNGDDFGVAYDNGFSSGYKQGYQEGLVAGQSLSSNSWTRLFGTIADTPIKVLRSLFDFDLFGMNVLVVTLSLLTGIIVINIVRKFI